MNEYEREDIQTIATLSADMKYLRGKADDAEDSIKSIKDDQKRLEEQLLIISTDLKYLAEKVKDLSMRTNRVGHFFKNNWYKIWIVAVTFLGAMIGFIGDYLWHLPPPAP